MKTVGYYTDPDLAEAVVQTLRQALDELTWLDNSYPIAQIGSNDDETYPRIYVSGTDSVDVRPDDGVDSYCFFEFYNAAVADEEEPVLYSLGVVFWIDLSQLDTTKTQDYTWNLISDVIRVLKENYCYNINVTTDDIFDRYSFELDKQQLMRKYSGFKITFDVYGDNSMCAYS